MPGAARTPAQALSAVPCACCPPNVPVTMETSPSQRRRSLRPLVQDNALFFLRSGSPALPGPAANAGARGDWGVPGSPGMAWWIQSWIQCQEGLCGVSWGEWLPCWSQGIPVQAPGEQELGDIPWGPAEPFPTSGCPWQDTAAAPLLLHLVVWCVHLCCHEPGSWIAASTAHNGSIHRGQYGRL